MTLAFVFVDPSMPEAGATLTRALEAGFSDFLVAGKEIPRDLLRLGRFESLALDGDRLLRSGVPVGTRIEIRSKSDEERAHARARSDEYVLVATSDWKVIPLENLVASFQGTRAKLLAEVGDAAEARVFLDTLEVGVHGVVLTSQKPAEIARLRELLDHRTVAPVRLEEATVVDVRPAGVGDRVCIDSCSLLSPAEGMLVGSASDALLLVASEASPSPYVASRPFRVNAGPVHAYVLLPRDRTKYLSELAAGDEVLAVDASGKARIVVVGRAKVERRPLLLVRARSGSREVATLLQNAETIRLVQPGGTVKSVVDLAPGDRVLLRTGGGAGRHFGMPVKETVSER
ncbi:MAG TPA: 3-dehydroquinate synthase II [Candidatus Thermoplasmatota archaeon]|nr:3-dehydroquinate synthase II [Candidatus Thermoplasmatota archaeon]